MIINKTWAMPNRSTFRIKPIYEFVNRYVGNGVGWIDPFAGLDNPINVEFNNDLNPKAITSHHMDALVFLDKYRLELKKNGVIYDPPYSVSQVKECYEGLGRAVTQNDTRADLWTRYKKAISDVVKPGGFVLSFGWNSGGIGKTLGFEQVEILMVAHGGIHNDTICVAEKRVGRPYSDGGGISDQHESCGCGMR